MVTLLERCLHALAVEPATVRLAVQEALSTLQPLYSPLPPEIAPALQALLDKAAGAVGPRLARSRAQATPYGRMRRPCTHGAAMAQAHAAVRATALRYGNTLFPFDDVAARVRALRLAGDPVAEVAEEARNGLVFPHRRDTPGMRHGRLRQMQVVRVLTA